MVIKAHRHFDLDVGEAMLERPAKDCQGSDSRPAQLSLIAELKATPNIFALSPDGRWYPVQYGEYALFRFMIMVFTQLMETYKLI